MKILKFETNIWKDENITDPIGNFVILCQEKTDFLGQNYFIIGLEN